jgi:hypothetical protein
MAAHLAPAHATKGSMSQRIAMGLGLPLHVVPLDASLETLALPAQANQCSRSAKNSSGFVRISHQQAKEE